MKEKELCILKQMLNSRHCRSILTGADSNFIRFHCGCFVNVFLGHVPANKSFIECKKIPFGKIVDPKFSSIANLHWDWGGGGGGVIPTGIIGY